MFENIKIFNRNGVQNSMNIHEYQGKEIFRSYGISVPDGQAAFSVDEAVAAAQKIATPVIVVKAQIHAGGRGKAGGVKIAKSLDEVKAYAGELLGKVLVTKQTGAAGKEVKRLLIESGCNIKKEYYAGLVVDRKSARVVLMVSAEGGMEIEEVAANSPEKIIKEYIDPLTGLTPYQARRAAFALGMTGGIVNKAADLFMRLYKVFLEKDCSIAEINPLVETAEGEVMALDVKLNFDDSALYRHPEIAALRDMSEEDEREVKAAEYGVNYIGLNGNIACMVNGAGLAMATMDIIKYYGGEPANFLDVGGQTTVDTVCNAFKIILSDKNVKSIFVNIFGGINKCDVIASGVVEAAKRIGLSVPLVVRLEGTNVELGKKILKDSGLTLTSAETLADGAQAAVKLAAEQGGQI
jgi:succinyl-CoA synthetase beta subunit